jgi:hypothetical protein
MSVRLSVASLLLFIFICSSYAYASEDTEIPATIEGKSPGSYAWVSIHEVFDPHGNIQHEYFLEGEDITDRINRRKAKADTLQQEVVFIGDDECKKHSIISFQGSGATSTTEFFKRAEVVFAGRIVAIDQGFSLNMSGTLLKVAVQEILKDSFEYEIDRYAFVFFPYSRFSILGEHFCRGELPDGYKIKVGDSVLVASYAMPADLSRQLVWTAGWELIFADSKTGRVLENKLLKAEICRNLGNKALDPGDLKLWGDDIPDFNALVAQIKDALAANDSTRPLDQ